jgi:NTP pyrophosphatase (non-canonical NTP hydrolase)
MENIIKKRKKRTYFTNGFMLKALNKRYVLFQREDVKDLFELEILSMTKDSGKGPGAGSTLFRNDRVKATSVGFSMEGLKDVSIVLNSFLKMKSWNVFVDIRNWAENKGILTHGTPEGQVEKLEEELEEVKQAIVNKDMDNLMEEIGDCVIVLTNLAALQGITIEKCIELSYKKISERSGKMVGGKFVKD